MEKKVRKLASAMAASRRGSPENEDEGGLLRLGSDDGNLRGGSLRGVRLLVLEMSAQLALDRR